MIDLQKALGGFWFSSASKFRDGEVVFYHEKGVSIHPLILFPYDSAEHRYLVGCDILIDKETKPLQLYKKGNSILISHLYHKEFHKTSSFRLNS